VIKKTVFGALLAALAIGILAGPASAAPVATASASCSIGGSYLPASYVTSIKTTRVGCGKAKKVVKAYHACRKAQGGIAGKCTKKVKGFKCKEGRRATAPGVQYSTTATCRKGGKKIVSAYIQNL
jgi:hypothetical protein